MLGPDLIGAPLTLTDPRSRRYAYAANVAVRAASAAGFLFAPGAVISRVSGRPADGVELIAVRALGCRHLGEVALLATRPRSALPVAVVDVVHASSMVALAGLSSRHRRVAQFGAASAAALAALSAAQWRGQGEPSANSGS